MSAKHSDDAALMLAVLRARRGIADGDECLKCDGFGLMIYPNTATWHGGIGGARLTLDVCQFCWGSGSASQPWPSWRDRERMDRLIEKLDAACGPKIAWINDLPADVRTTVRALRALREFVLR